MWRRPVLIINNANGDNILPKLRGLWRECTVVDCDGSVSDTAEIVCVGPPSRVGMPQKGDKYDIHMGWADQGPVLQGSYTFQTARCDGRVESGDIIVLTFRAADYNDKLKAHGRMHHEGKTFGEIVEAYAKKAGLKPNIDRSLAQIKVPYRLQMDQSHMDFLSGLGADYGAVVKPANGMLNVMRRGSGQSVSGKDLPPIHIRRKIGWGYTIVTDCRPQTGHVAASWIDEKTGKRRLVKQPTGADGPIYMLPHMARSEEEAKALAKAEAFDRGNNTGEGSFEFIAQPDAWAGAPVFARDYGWPIDGRWQAARVAKSVTDKGGFTMTVDVSAGANKKDKKE